MKKTLLFLLLFTGTGSMALCQQVIYYDSVWAKTSKENAYTRVEKQRQGNLFSYKVFYNSTNTLFSEATYLDSSYQKRVGISRVYHPNGAIKDSMVYNDSSKKIYGLHHDENGKLLAEYHFDPATKKENIKGFDENGKLIPDFVYEKEASFPGGAEGWKKHLFTNLQPNIPVKKGAASGIYRVMIRFTVDKDGTLHNIVAETAYGYGMEEEAVRVVKKSPRWIPAIQFNKPVKAYRRQPVTFAIE